MRGTENLIFKVFHKRRHYREAKASKVRTQQKDSCAVLAQLQRRVVGLILAGGGVLLGRSSIFFTRGH
jgi:hypothetical protein